MEAVIQLLEEAEATGLNPPDKMINSDVLVLVQNDQLEAACDLVNKTLRMNMKGSRTRMWNYVIQAYSSDLERVAEMGKLMLRSGVQPDSMSYTTILRNFHKVHSQLA